MFRLWGKLITDKHLVKDTVIVNETNNTRTHKVMQAVEDICYEFDLAKPLWLETNLIDFKKHNATRFTKDSFVEAIDFDYLEIQMIEEDGM